MLELFKNGTAHGEISLICLLSPFPVGYISFLRKRPQGNADYGSGLLGW